jgi:hypothetical protein
MLMATSKTVSNQAVSRSPRLAVQDRRRVPERVGDPHLQCGHRLRQPHLFGARSFWTTSRLERDALALAQRFKYGDGEKRAAVREILDTVFTAYEAEALLQ